MNIHNTTHYIPDSLISNSVEEEIEKLTHVNVNDTTKIFGSFMMVALFFIAGVLGVIAGMILTIVLMFIFGIFFSLINGFHTGNFAYSGDFGVLGNIFPLIIFGCIVYAQYMNKLLLNKLNILTRLREGVLLLYSKLTNTTQVTENIEQIYSLVQDIFQQTETIKKLLFFRFFFSRNGKEKLKKLGVLATHIALMALQNTRSDLIVRLKEQQSSLESAKSEVEKNISGTSELNQVSELQRARLDRQIAQFEELQRVMMRV